MLIYPSVIVSAKDAKYSIFSDSSTSTFQARTRLVIFPRSDLTAPMSNPSPMTMQQPAEELV